MEIVDYLRAARRRIALIILIPLISAGAAAALLFFRTPVYTATAVVDPPALVGGPTAQYTGSQGVIQFVAAFQATASGPAVRERVSQQARVTTEALGDRLVVLQRGGSSSVAVTYTSTQKDVVEPVVTSAARVTLETMFSTQVNAAQSRVDDATAALASANEAVGAFTAKHRMADPQKAYEAQLSRVNALVQQQATMRATGNAVGAAAMSSTIASASAALQGFGPILNEYTALVEARTAAVANVNTAQAQLSQAQSQFDAADPDKFVYLSGARLVDSSDTIVRTIIAVAVAAFFLSLLLVFMLEVIRRGRTERATQDTAADTSAAPAAGGPAPHGPGPVTPTKTSGSAQPGVPARAKH